MSGRPGKGVERRRLHLDRDDAGGGARRDRRLRFAKRRVGGPARTAMNGLADRRRAALGERHHRRIGLGPGRRRQVVIARPLVAQGPVDDDMVGWRPEVADLTRGRDADQEPAAGHEALFGDEHREGRTDRVADDAVSDAIAFPFPELRMIAGPVRRARRAVLGSDPLPRCRPSGSRTRTGGICPERRFFCLRASRSMFSGRKAETSVKSSR